MLKMKLIKPDLVLGIGKEEEFELFQKFYGEQFWVVPPASQVSKKTTIKGVATENGFFLCIFPQQKAGSWGGKISIFFLPYHPYFFLQRHHREEGTPVFEFSDSFALILGSPEKKHDRECRVVTPSSLLSSICGLYTEEGQELG